MAQTRDDQRAERLKAALRDNLRRRKDQSRARGETDKTTAERPEPKTLSS